MKQLALSDPKFLAYFLPRSIRQEETLLMTTVSNNNKNIEFEIVGYNLVELEPSINFLSSLENRFCIYENKPFFVQQEFSLCFNKLYSSVKGCISAKKDKKPQSKVGILPFVLEKNSLFKHPFLVKSRLLRLTKGGYISACFGSPAFIVRSSFFSNFYNQKSYKSWFSLNLNYYGLLSSFLVVRCNKMRRGCSNFTNQQWSKKVKFYYYHNEVTKYLFLLAKPKYL